MLCQAGRPFDAKSFPAFRFCNQAYQSKVFSVALATTIIDENLDSHLRSLHKPLGSQGKSGSRCRHRQPLRDQVGKCAGLDPVENVIVRF